MGEGQAFVQIRRPIPERADQTKTNDTGSLLTTNFSNVQTAGFNAAGDC